MREKYISVFLSAFAKLRKAANRFVMSVRLSVFGQRVPLFRIFFREQRNKAIILMVDVNNKTIVSDGKYVREKSVDCPVLICLDI